MFQRIAPEVLWVRSYCYDKFQMKNIYVKTYRRALQSTYTNRLMMSTSFSRRAVMPILLIGVFLLNGAECVELQRESHDKDIKLDVLRKTDDSLNGMKSTRAIECNLPFQDIGGRCLFIDPVTDGPWNDLRIYCNSFGGQLAMLDSADLVYDIVQFITLNGLSERDYWIGGSDIDTEGLFLWLDGTQVKMGPPFWAYDPSDGIQQPVGGVNQNCILFSNYFYYGFDDYYCDFVANFICEQTQ